MVCITVSRKDLRRISCGKKGKIQIKKLPSKATDARGLMVYLNDVVSTRYPGRRRTK